MAEKRTKLTREEMEAILHEGGSVLHGGKIIARIEDLPSAADLAVGDADAEAAATRSIDEQIARLSAERAKLGESKLAPEPAAEEADDADHPTRRPKRR